MRIAIITPGWSLVPATKGDAVENLIQNIIDTNEEQKKLDIVLISIYEKQAFRKAQKYKKTEFRFSPIPT